MRKTIAHQIFAAPLFVALLEVLALLLAASLVIVDAAPEFAAAVTSGEVR